MNNPNYQYMHIALAVAFLGTMAAPSFAVSYELRADVVTKSMPDGTQVVMWGFADASQAGAQATVPGPPLVVPPEDDTLIIHLRNNLTATATGRAEGTPVSIVIPGLVSTEQPVKVGSDAQPYRKRVRSLARETPPDNATVVDYQWTGVKPGTYLYHSGTQMQVQVQMGLYGAMKKSAGDKLAYPGVPYDTELTLLYSEIDPDLHAAVATDNYGPGKAMTSTVNYRPKYFLINGEPYSQGQQALAAGNLNDTVLLRFLSASLKSHVPTLTGSYMRLVAEDAKPYAYPKEQYSLLLAAGKTCDALWSAPAGGKSALIDRRLYLTTGDGAAGGMLTYLNVDVVPGTPVATPDSYSIAEDSGPLVVPAGGVLGNDSISSGGPVGSQLTAALVHDVAHGTLALSSDGSFNYSPAANYSGTDQFTYRAMNGILKSREVAVALNVTPVNDPPLAVDDQAWLDAGMSASIDVLVNDIDVDGDTLMAHVHQNPSHGTVSIEPDHTITYTPSAGFVGQDSFMYMASDGVAESNIATVTVNVVSTVNAAPRAVNDSAQTQTNAPVTINVVANDTDSDGTVDPATVTVTRTPRRGTAVANADGTVTYTPQTGYRGQDNFRYTVRDNRGAVSNEATVRVSVVRPGAQRDRGKSRH